MTTTHPPRTTDHDSWAQPSRPPRRPSRRLLSRDECEAWIAGHHEARLGFWTGRGRRFVVIGYAVTAHEVLLLMPECHPATGYVVGSAVTLEVDGALTGGGWESVRAVGVASSEDQQEAGSWHPYGASWPPGIATHAVHVPLAELEGFVRAA